jgi:8-oxo-dGTP diphosphatase
MRMIQGAIRFGIKLLFGKNILTGVPAIIKNSKGEILLGKRNKMMIFYPNMWGLPGGLIEFGETIEQAVKRELKEELDIKAKIIKYVKPQMQMPSKECPIQYLDTPVYCKIISGTPKPKDETSEVRWFSPKELKSMKLAYSHKQILKNERII